MAVTNAHLEDLLVLEENALLNAANLAGATLALQNVCRSAPKMIPVRTSHLPEIGQVPEAGVDGTPRVDPLKEAMKIVEAEKQKVLTYHEQLMEKPEKEEIPYNPHL